MTLQQFNLNHSRYWSLHYVAELIIL